MLTNYVMEEQEPVSLRITHAALWGWPVTTDRIVRFQDRPAAFFPSTVMERLTREHERSRVSTHDGVMLL